MKTTQVKGTKDFLPKEQNLRDNIKNTIENTYKSYGFTKISTPILEDIENLKNSDGGDNIKLIFEVLKRGEKFDKAIENNEYDKLCDLGLRYDLTLPLSRFYAANKENLPKPFKSIQIDRVYRADRPQKGRMREFYQCDIDIIGSNNINCEIELILVTMKALEKLGLIDLVVKINDRQVLKSLIKSFGYSDSEIDNVCISFDKLDKISKEDIIEELRKKGLNEIANKNFYEFLNNLDSFDYSKLENIENVTKIIEIVNTLSNGKIKIEPDISLVRGQGYYTGCVFEIRSKNFNGAIAGGGRYDGLIGKFTGENVPAVGFSIGFERICALLEEQDIKFNQKQKAAVFYEESNFIEKFNFAEKLREEYDVCLFESPKKFGKFLDKLVEQGYNYFVSTFSEELKPLNDL